ncbi:hypothetical protein DFH09DRAFT_834599, partial [Mycena vulgaris]
SPVGLIWDSTHWSCGYDSLFAPLACLWASSKTGWTATLNRVHPLLGLWANTMLTDELTPENSRNNVRRILHFQDPAKFPVGPVGLILDHLLTAV